MLVSFSFSNFKSFKDENKISLVASQNDESGVYTHPTPFGYSVLKSAAVYGANASGKTKLFDAMNYMRSVVCPPQRGKVPSFDFWKNRYDAFRLNTYSQEEKSFFEVVFILDDIQYRYGFEQDANGISEEWLYRKSSRERLILSRNGDKPQMTVSRNYFSAKRFSSIESAGMVSQDALLLAVLAAFNDPLAKDIVGWFEKLTVISANELRTPIKALMNGEQKKQIIKFLQVFDINIEDLSMHEISPDAIPEKIRGMIGEEGLKGTVYDGVSTTHKIYNELYEKTGTAQFMMEIDESFGTNRLLCLAWPIIKALQEGSVLFIDEIDSGIHQFVICAILELFYRVSGKAQLILNTHNASLLNLSYKMSNGKPLFRKDQIYIVSKNRYGESNVYPATDFRTDMRSNIEKLYLDGKLTGVPHVDLDTLFEIAGHGS